MTRREKFIILILAIILIALAIWADRCHAQPAGFHLETNVAIVPCRWSHIYGVDTNGLTDLGIIVDHEYDQWVSALPHTDPFLSLLVSEQALDGVRVVWRESHATTRAAKSKTIAPSSLMPPMPGPPILRTLQSQPAITTHFGPPAPICTPASFSWACVSPVNAVLDPVSKWDCYSQLNLDFIAESNKCYQVEWSEGATFSDGSLVWHPITTICPRPFTAYNFVAVPIQNCTWVDPLIYPMPTNLLVTTYGTMYRLNSHY